MHLKNNLRWMTGENLWKITTVWMITILSWTGCTAEEQYPLSRQAQKNEPLLYEIRAGILLHDVDIISLGTRKEEGIDISAEVTFNRSLVTIFRGNIRPNLGISINDHGDTSKIYSGVLWEINTEHFFVDLGFGLSVHSGSLDSKSPDKRNLGSRILFRSSIEVGYEAFDHHRISLVFDHISNASLMSPNEGMDTLGLRYGYHF